MPPPTKRRRTEPTAVEEIAFDPAARQEYLTGFHKRKLQRAKHAQELAVQRAKAERIEARRKLREERKADLERHVQEVNALLRPASTATGSEPDEDSSGSEGEWAGISEPEPAPAPVDHEAEYVDEEKYTTVTVETLDVSRESLYKVEHESGPEDTPPTPAGDGETGQEHASTEDKKRKWTKDKPRAKSDKPKKKKRDFRYESKAERKVSRTKERAKNSRQARERRAG